MCGRYYIAIEEEDADIGQILEEISGKYSGTPEYAALKTGEIFPTETVPVLIAPHGRNREARLMKWGFPGFGGRGVVINARSETAEEKLTFRRSVKTGRCLVPATGFYEWRHSGTQKKKDKYLLRLPDTPTLYFAGLYDIFRDAAGKPYPAFAIVTTDANDSVRPLHDRMPLILNGEDRQAWLQDEGFARKLLHRACDAQLEMALQWDTVQSTFLE